MAQTLSVEHEELMARANELEQPLPIVPSGFPQAPCAVPFVRNAETQLMISADAMRQYLDAGQQQWRRLARSLRNAAKAYEEVDEDAAQTLTTSMSALTPGGADGSRVTMTSDGPDYRVPDYSDPDYVLPPRPPPSRPVEIPYYHVRQAAADIVTPDQGRAFLGFADDWDMFQRGFQSMALRFRPFVDWEGVSATAVEANFELHRQWIKQMVEACVALSRQATSVVSAQRWAVPQHPTAYEIYFLDEWIQRYRTDPRYQDSIWELDVLIKRYAAAQQKSQEVLDEYVRRVPLPLSPAYPPAPPKATKIDEQKKDDPDDKPDDKPDGWPDGNPDGRPDPDDEISDLPPSMPPTTPPMPPTGPPPMPDGLKDALAGGPGLPTGEPTLKPASVGGGGGGMPGVPSMPMQPAVGPESGSAGSSGPGGAGAGLAGAGAGAGRGMGGGMGAPMAPMGGAGGQGNKEGKKGPSEDESLYEEDRAWTEGIIGNRRRKDAPDK